MSPIEEIIRIVCSTNEVNMGNYDDEDVRGLNDGMIEIFNICNEHWPDDVKKALTS